MGLSWRRHKRLVAFVVLADVVYFGKISPICLWNVLQDSSTPLFDEVSPVQANAAQPPDTGAYLIPNIKDPLAIDAQTVCPGYHVTDVKSSSYGVTATLSLAGKPCNLYGTDVDVLSLKVEYQSANRLSVNIVPAFLDNSNRSYYVLDPDSIPLPATKGDASANAEKNDFEFSWNNIPSFSFTVKRKSNGDKVFDTSGTVLVYENQFIEFASSLPKNYNINGLGEILTSFRIGHHFNATMYSADIGDPLDRNLYGVHPFYLETRYFETQDNKQVLITDESIDANGIYKSYVHGLFNRNSHGQDVLLRPQNITWRALGGSIDLYFLTGPTQEAVTQQYQQEVVGLPAMQQYFALGFHQCRWGYKNWTELENVVNNFRTSNIPLETIWVDIDLYDKYRDFTTDLEHYPLAEGQKFLASLHKNDQHFIPIVDSAIYIPNPTNGMDQYGTYTRGHDLDVFMKNPDGSQYIGEVWPGFTVFPDWRSKNAVSWWSDEVSRWHNDVPFDGIWIDMSEVSSFCAGSCGSDYVTRKTVRKPFALPGEPGNEIFTYPEGFNLTNATEAAVASAAAASQSAANKVIAPRKTSTTSYLRTTPTPGVRNIEHPPYVINHVHGDLSVHAVSPNATHQDGVQEYDVHSLFGHQILHATHQALLHTIPGKRPLIIGRSTFAGSGKWAGHWGGDNGSQFYYLYFSITQALTFSLFGIPFFGVDTCGFGDNTSEELCNRWMQLSAFFPFYRNHNSAGSISQEPYLWASVAEASRVAMRIRYSLLPYIYTLFQQAHTTGSTVMRALAWEFPNDPLLASADRQFLLGPSLLVTPVLVQGAKSVSGVFPGLKDGQIWYDWYTHAPVTGIQPGQNVSIPAPLGFIPVYIRGGSVLPIQEPGYTIKECRRNPWGLIVALSSGGESRGHLYLDDGESITPSASLSIDFSASKGSLSVNVTGTYIDTNPLANITILGVKQSPEKVLLNDVVLDSGVSYHATTQELSLTRLNSLTKGGAWSKDWHLSWQ